MGMRCGGGRGRKEVVEGIDMLGTYSIQEIKARTLELSKPIQDETEVGQREILMKVI